LVQISNWPWNRRNLFDFSIISMAQSVSISMSSQGIVEDEQRTTEVRALGQPAERASRL